MEMYLVEQYGTALFLLYLSDKMVTETRREKNYFFMFAHLC